ncbi:hypothetical protein BDN70DRAFT_643153 [Pholiota conissans]|uniref:Uncharacterized protein n=1 Tax=Pholiota conissans TaxID=109636 RepID=A0A9P5Z3P1_9AGAR|nr:hypothetical protein BDN70DRAFT_643153 [Pholiota conissans]
MRMRGWLVFTRLYCYWQLAFALCFALCRVVGCGDWDFFSWIRVTCACMSATYVVCVCD